jgi:hypothetical protein
MIMDCVIRYKNMMLIAKIKFEEFILKLVYTDLRSRTTMVTPIKYSGSVPNGGRSHPMALGGGSTTLND